MLLLTEGHCLREQALAICGTANSGSADGRDFRATSLETIRQMVATGMGCTLLSALALGNRSGSITLRPLANVLGRRIGLVWRRGSSRTRDLRLLADTLRAHLPRSVHRV
jgi:LysR family hydrogen peroxide-inducible transcriptional activator